MADTTVLRNGERLSIALPIGDYRLGADVSVYFHSLAGSSAPSPQLTLDGVALTERTRTDGDGFTSVTFHGDERRGPAKVTLTMNGADMDAQWKVSVVVQSIQATCQVCAM